MRNDNCFACCMPLFSIKNFIAECTTNEPTSQWGVKPPDGEDWEVELITASTTLYPNHSSGEKWAIGTSSFTATPYWGSSVLEQVEQWHVRFDFEYEFTYRDVALVASGEVMYKGRDSRYFMIDGVLHRIWPGGTVPTSGGFIYVRLRN